MPNQYEDTITKTPSATIKVAATKGDEIPPFNFLDITEKSSVCNREQQSQDSIALKTNYNVWILFR